MSTARKIVRALGGTLNARGGIVPGPGHSARDRSVSITDAPGTADGILVYSFAGDDPLAIKDWLRALGLLHYRAQLKKTPQPALGLSTSDDRGRSTYALSIWDAAEPAGGTLAEIYLRSRGITLPPSPALRHHPALKHPSGDIWPSMVALVMNGVDGVPVAVHRTFLDRNGTGKAPVEPVKLMLGPCRGGAVRLADPGAVLMVGEGIETCLAAMQATLHPAWAALSTSGMRSLDLPHDVRDVIILADGDDSGEAAAQACAWRWKQEGRRVRIARPPQGMDFNDMLMARAPRNGADAK